MELQPELKKLVDYLAPLAGSDPQKPSSHEVTKHAWELLAGNMGAAADKLGEAAELVRKAIPLAYSSPKKQRRLVTCVDAILERRFDAGDLERRAKVLKDRAQPDPVLSLVEEAQLEAAEEAVKKAKAETQVVVAAAAIAKQVAKALQRDVALERVEELLSAIDAALDSVEAAATQAAAEKAAADKAAADKAAADKAAAEKAAADETAPVMADGESADGDDADPVGGTEPAPEPPPGPDESPEPQAAAPDATVETPGTSAPTDDGLESDDQDEEDAEAASGQALQEASTDEVRKASELVAEQLGALRELVLKTLYDLSPTSDLPPPTPPSPPPPGPSLLDRADVALRSCQGTLETARGHLGDTATLDEAATAFLNDLDLLVELVLEARRSLSVTAHG